MSVKIKQEIVLSGGWLYIDPMEKICSRNAPHLDAPQGKGVGFLFSCLQVGLASLERQVLYGLRTNLSEQ